MSNPDALAGAVVADTAIEAGSRAEPRGARPRPTLSRRNIILYGTLIVVALYYLLPLYVMVVTSLKGMPEIRLGNIFSPPMEITFQPWVKAWAEACTGLNCDGLSRGFWNSVRITVPSVFLSIASMCWPRRWTTTRSATSCAWHRASAKGGSIPRAA